MSIYQTRIELVDGFPYEVRVHRTLEKRKLNRLESGKTSLQQQLNATATNTIEALHNSNFSNYSLTQLLVGVGLKDNPPADPSADGAGPILDPYPAPGTYWDVTTWIQWFNNVKVKYGQDTAVSKFAQFWNQRGTGGHEGDFIDDPTFRSFIHTYGLDESIPDLKNIIATEAAEDKAKGIVRDAAGNILQTGDNLTKITKDVTGKGDQVINSTGAFIKWMPWIIGGAALIIVGVIAYVLVSEKKTIISTAGKLV